MKVEQIITNTYVITAADTMGLIQYKNVILPE